MKGAGTAKNEAERLVIGLSGASGVAYGIRLLEACRGLGDRIASGYDQARGNDHRL